MFIYLITNAVNGKYYVGQTTQTPGDRMCGHRACSRQGSPMRLHRAMRKYGPSCFQQQVLAVAETQGQLDLLERLWIAVLNSTDFRVGYNASPGGDSRSPESIEKGRLKLLGAGNPNFGKTWSPEVKQRMSEGRKNKGTGKRPESVCRKIAETRRAKIASGEIKMPEGGNTYWSGKTQSAESNRKRSVTQAGQCVGALNSMFGRKHTEETLAKMRASHAARKEAAHELA